MKKKINYWQISTVAFGVLFVLSAFNIFSFSSGSNAANEAVSFINTNVLDGTSTATLQSVERTNGVYKLTLAIDDQMFESYVSGDGKLLFPTAIPLAQSSQITGATTVDLSSESSLGILEVSAANGISLGPEDAATIVIEFSDFQCPFCAMASGLPSWVSSYGSQYGDLIGVAGNIQEMASRGELRFIYVPMSFLGQESIYSTQAALCANEQGKFWEMHDAIFTAHDSKENNGKFAKDKLEIIAGNIEGLDTGEFNNCLENDLTLEEAQSINMAAGNAGVTGTPTFFVNGKKVSSSWTAISAAIGA